MFLPLIFVLIIGAVPLLGDLMNFILLGSGRWNYDILSYNKLIFGVVYSLGFIFFIDKLKGKQFYKLILFGLLVSTVGMAFSGITIFSLDFSIVFMFIATLIYNIIQSLGGDMLLVPLIGRVSGYLPDGFESTGLTVIISLTNFSGITNNLLSAFEINYFGCNRGYYDRTKLPLMLNTAVSTGLMLLAPLFLSSG